ncbi:MAG: phosphoribosyltransferase [Brumimicrobium sp.]|nr:phosphoribosyltransferase [Brumimicrobium sp.]MCO5269111.1 phosphoribosyltransferase [Brumimicrobium sp.]
MITQILNEKQITQKLDRIAYQIAEDSFEESKLFIIGIKGNGYKIAEAIARRLKTINKQEVILAELEIDKKNPLNKNISITIPTSDLDKHMVILVDDVLNSGRTMQYALTKILEQPVKSIKTVALVDRKHRDYPIRCDFVGLTLSTTLQERVEVEISKESRAYLV